MYPPFKQTRPYVGVSFLYRDPSSTYTCPESFYSHRPLLRSSNKLPISLFSKDLKTWKRKLRKTSEQIHSVLFQVLRLCSTLSVFRFLIPLTLPIPVHLIVVLMKLQSSFVGTLLSSEFVSLYIRHERVLAIAYFTIKLVFKLPL